MDHFGSGKDSALRRPKPPPHPPLHPSTHHPITPSPHHHSPPTTSSSLLPSHCPCWRSPVVVCGVGLASTPLLCSSAAVAAPSSLSPLMSTRSSSSKAGGAGSSSSPSSSAGRPWRPFVYRGWLADAATYPLLCAAVFGGGLLTATAIRSMTHPPPPSFTGSGEAPPLSSFPPLCTALWVSAVVVRVGLQEGERSFGCPESRADHRRGGSGEEVDLPHEAQSNGEVLS